MAKQEFLDNLRIARNLFYHPRVTTDSTGLDPQSMQEKIARAAIWLTPKSVRAFSADDFPELGCERQRELQAAVREFLAVANQVPAAAAATPEQFSNAKAAFARILQILMPYLPTAHEADDLENTLKQVEFPPWIVNWDYELGSDQDGEPALWVNLYADETAAPRKEFGRAASRINAKLLEVLMRNGSNRWPYIRMRTAVEHKTA